MKKQIQLSFCAFLLFHASWAQTDSTRFVADTARFEKQRFIDSYDYVFMTKEPTKWMLKLTFDVEGANNFSPIWLRFEKKITPSFSVQFGAFPTIVPTYDIGQQGGYLIGDGVNVPSAALGSSLGAQLRVRLAVTGEVRWYYDLKKRIAEGKSMNNFSANYFSVRFNDFLGNDNSRFYPASRLISYDGKTWQTDYDFRQLKNQIALRYGIQRRFLKSGLIDFGVALSRTSFAGFNQKIAFKDGDNTVKPFGSRQNEYTTTWTETNPPAEWFLQTSLSLGVAFGDFKKTPKRPLCDVLRCYESQTSLVKVTWPNISLGLRNQSFSGALAYEHKLFNSPLSVNVAAEYGGDFRQNQLGGALSAGTFGVSSFRSYLQTRYYFTQARRIRNHDGGNNLSGVYVAASAVFAHQRIKWSNFSGFSDQRFPSTRFGVGPTIGFQQKLFGSGFIDFHLTVARNFIDKGTNFAGRFSGVHGGLNLGFAF